MIPDLQYFLSAPQGRCTKKHIYKQFPELFDALEKVHPESAKYAERIYMYYHGLTVPPKCPVCGGVNHYIDMSRGYSITCSRKCNLKNTDRAAKISKSFLGKSDEERANIIRKRESTCLERYGVTNASTTPEVRQKVRQTNQKLYGGTGLASDVIKSKAQETCMERYGAPNPGANAEVRQKIRETQIKNYGGMGLASDVIKSKAQETCMERYGGLNPHCSVTVHEKAIITQIKKYGDAGFASKDLLERARETCQSKYGIMTWPQKDLLTKYPELICFNGSDWTIKCPHPGCTKCSERSFVTPRRIYLDRKRFGTEVCTKLLQVQASHSKDTTTELFIQSILDKYAITYEKNVRNLVAPKEVDIYIPDRKIAIECNGVYFHSDKYKPINYHYDKFRACLDRGIQLISIWSDWIKSKPQIVESFIKSKLGICESRIFARKCTVAIVDPKTASNFLNKSHIQGRCNAKIHIGLYLKDELVALMCFAKRSKLSGPKTVNDGEWELIRFCNKLDVTVVGGAGKLLTYFISHFKPSKIISFSSNDISVGSLYKRLGFSRKRINTPGYWYTDPDEIHRYHRSSFTRSAIVKKWPEYDINDRTWTERQVMDSKRYRRFYDSGTILWELCI